MAERFPRFERRRTGLATPRLDFVSAAQAEARSYGAMSDAIGRMSQFAFEKAGQSAAAAGAEEGALEPTEVLKRTLGQDPALMTIYEKSAYQAATKALSSEVEAKARFQMQEVALEAEREQLNPEDTASRLNDVIDGYASSFNILSPETQARLKTTLGSVRDSHFLQQTNAYLKAQDAQSKAESSYAVTDYHRTIERLGRQQVDSSVLEANISMLRTFMEGKRYSPEEIVKEEISSRNKFHKARLDGAWEDLDSLNDRMVFMAELKLQQEKGGPLIEGLDDSVIEAKITTFAAQIKREMDDLKSKGKDLASDFKSVATNVDKGYLPDPSVISKFDKKRNELSSVGVDTSEYDKLRTGMEAAAERNRTYNQLGIPDLEALRVGFSKAVQDGATQDEIDNLEAVEKRLNFMKKEIKRDPVGAGQYTGRIDPTPVTDVLVREPDRFAEVAETRIEQVRAFNRQNNIEGPYNYLNDEEVVRFQEVFREGDVNSKMSLIRDLSSAFGQNSREVFRQISEKDPTLAHVGGLMMGGSGPVTIRAALVGQAILDAKEAPTIEGESSDKNIALNEMFASGVFPAGIRSSITATANAIYEGLATNREKFDVDKFEQAVQLAAGQVIIKGNTYGGIAKLNDRPIIVPNNFLVDDEDAVELEELFEKASAEDWIATVGALPTAQNGEPIGIDRLRDNLILRSINDGVYAVGVKEGGRDQYFNTPEGEVYLINVQDFKSVYDKRTKQ